MNFVVTLTWTTRDLNLQALSWWAKKKMGLFFKCNLMGNKQL